MHDTITIPNAPTPIIAMASGKGGAGKTGLTLNMATALAKKGKRVLVFDGDIGLANVDVQLGIAPEKDLSHVITGHARLEDIITKSERGIHIIPGRSGFEKVPFLTTLERRNILNQLRDLSGAYDLVIIDVAAGVDDEVLGLANFADSTVMVVTPDPSSITDAYAVLKLLKIKHEKNNGIILINQAGTETEGKKTYEKIKTAAENFLHISIPLLGIVPYCRHYAMAVKMQQLAVTAHPNAKSSEEITLLAEKLLDIHQATRRVA